MGCYGNYYIEHLIRALMRNGKLVLTLTSAQIRVFSTVDGNVDGTFVASVAGVEVNTRVELTDGQNVSHLKIRVSESAVSLW